MRGGETVGYTCFYRVRFAWSDDCLGGDYEFRHTDLHLLFRSWRSYQVMRYPVFMYLK